MSRNSTVGVKDLLIVSPEDGFMSRIMKRNRFLDKLKLSCTQWSMSEIFGELLCLTGIIMKFVYTIQDV
jgi:hypothetical protein